jgi:hypothetical protein
MPSPEEFAAMNQESECARGDPLSMHSKEGKRFCPSFPASLAASATLKYAFIHALRGEIRTSAFAPVLNEMILSCVIAGPVYHQVS